MMKNKTQNKKFRVINFPIYDCFKDRFALSLNFERLNILRPDYGYRSKKSSKQIHWQKNSTDGIYYIDLINNSNRLLISIEQVIGLHKKENMFGLQILQD